MHVSSKSDKPPQECDTAYALDGKRDDVSDLLTPFGYCNCAPFVKVQIRMIVQLV